MRKVIAVFAVAGSGTLDVMPKHLRRIVHHGERRCAQPVLVAGSRADVPHPHLTSGRDPSAADHANWLPGPGRASRASTRGCPGCSIQKRGTLSAPLPVAFAVQVTDVPGATGKFLLLETDVSVGAPDAFITVNVAVLRASW